MSGEGFCAVCGSSEEQIENSGLQSLVKQLQDDVASMKSSGGGSAAAGGLKVLEEQVDNSGLQGLVKQLQDDVASMKSSRGLKVMSWFKMVDGNGLALMCFGFSTFMFFAFNCNVNKTGFTDIGPDEHFGVHFLADMLTWGVGVGLTVAGVAQGLQGDALGFTSYIFHSAILGSIGYQFDDLLTNEGGQSLYLVSWMLYAATFVNFIFTIMAFRIAVVFGVLYFTVAVMFLFVGLNFSQKIDNSKNDPSDTSGGMIAGIFCLIVSIQCFILLIPVMTGYLTILFRIPNPFAKPPPEAPPAEDGVPESQTTIKLVDANGLALTWFGTSTFMFFVFKCNIDGTNWGNPDDPTDPKTNHAAPHMLTGMLTWGVGLSLLIAGIFQFMNGDHLGFTSYLFHAAILGTTGWWLNDLLAGFGASTYIYAYFYYAAFWYNMIFAMMAFKKAKMFGVLYFTVGIMFLFVGLDWQQAFDDPAADPATHTGSYIAGICCLVVALQCFYLLVPLMTGLGVIM